MKRKIFTLVLAIFTIVLCISCGNSNKTNGKKVIRIGFPGTKNFLSGVAGVAQGNEYIETELGKVGYEVEYKPFPAAGPAVNEALTANEIDIAIYADFPGILSKSKGVKTSLIGITDNYITSAIIVKPDSDITSVEELRGKKIGFTKGTYMQKYLYEVLAKNGVSKEAVELINTNNDVDSLLQSGSIDAAVVTDTQEALQVITNKTAKVIDTSKNDPTMTAQSVIVGNSKFLSENKEAVIAFFKALNEAKTFMIENTNESYDILTRSGLNMESIESLYNKDNQKFDYVSLKIDDEVKTKIINSKKFMLDNKLITNDFDVNEWIDNSFYEEANK